MPCSPDPSYFASPSYLTTSIHIVTIFSIPFSIYGVFCILKITPKQMSNAKFPLLNAHFWTIILDVFFNILSIPMFFFPSASGIMLGYGASLIPPTFLLYSIQALVAVFFSSAIGLFENRQNVVQTRWKIGRSWIRVLMNVINYLVAVGTVIPPYLRKVDVEKARMEILKIIPCPIPSFFSPHLFIQTDTPQLVSLLMFLQTIILFPQAVFFVSHTLYHLVYVNSSRVSQATKKLQFKFLIGSLLQFSIPTFVILQPILYIWFSVNTGYYNQELNNHIILIISLHGFISSFCMIMVHSAYRNHFLRLIRLGRTDKLTPVIVSIVPDKV